MNNMPPIDRDELIDLGFAEIDTEFICKPNMEGKYTPLQMYRLIYKQFEDIYFKVVNKKDSHIVYKAWVRGKRKKKLSKVY